MNKTKYTINLVQQMHFKNYFFEAYMISKIQVTIEQKVIPANQNIFSYSDIIKTAKIIISVVIINNKYLYFFDFSYFFIKYLKINNEIYPKL